MGPKSRKRSQPNKNLPTMQQHLTDRQPLQPRQLLEPTVAEEDTASIHSEESSQSSLLNANIQHDTTPFQLLKQRQPHPLSVASNYDSFTANEGSMGFSSTNSSPQPSIVGEGPSSVSGSRGVAFDETPMTLRALRQSHHRRKGLPTKSPPAIRHHPYSSNVSSEISAQPGDEAAGVIVSFEFGWTTTMAGLPFHHNKGNYQDTSSISPRSIPPMIPSSQVTLSEKVVVPASSLLVTPRASPYPSPKLVSMFPSWSAAALQQQLQLQELQQQQQQQATPPPQSAGSETLSASTSRPQRAKVRFVGGLAGWFNETDDADMTETTPQMTNEVTILVSPPPETNVAAPVSKSSSKNKKRSTASSKKRPNARSDKSPSKEVTV